MSASDIAELKSRMSRLEENVEKILAILTQNQPSIYQPISAPSILKASHSTPSTPSLTTKNVKVVVDKKTQGAKNELTNIVATNHTELGLSPAFSSNSSSNTLTGEVSITVYKDCFLIGGQTFAIKDTIKSWGAKFESSNKTWKMPLTKLEDTKKSLREMVKNVVETSISAKFLSSNMTDEVSASGKSAMISSASAVTKKASSTTVSSSKPSTSTSSNSNSNYLENSEDELDTYSNRGNCFIDDDEE